MVDISNYCLWLISPMTMVCAGYNHNFHGIYFTIHQHTSLGGTTVKYHKSKIWRKNENNLYLLIFASHCNPWGHSVQSLGSFKRVQGSREQNMFLSINKTCSDFNCPSSESGKQKIENQNRTISQYNTPCFHSLFNIYDGCIYIYISWVYINNNDVHYGYTLIYIYIYIPIYIYMY